MTHENQPHELRSTFNRTSMELKHCLPTLILCWMRPFNRTSMELKLKTFSIDDVRFHQTFNRTSMELKLRSNTHRRWVL